MKLWKFRTANFVVECFTEKDTLDTSYMESSLAKECREKVKSGEWKCFQTTVRVKHRLSNEVLAEEFLSNSIYANPKDFIDHRGMNKHNHGSYFSDMVRTACVNAREEIKRRREETKDALAKLDTGKVR